MQREVWVLQLAARFVTIARSQYRRGARVVVDGVGLSAMGLGDIRAQHIRAAIDECNDRGELNFLAHYGFKWARRFLLLHKARYYPSKAIVGVAHRHTNAGRALTYDEFNGGDRHAYGAARILRNMKFTVVDRPLDDWPLWPSLDVASATLKSRFPRWKRWSDRDQFDELAWPGIYVIGVFGREPPSRVMPLPEEVVYVGQTTRTLRERLAEFHKSASDGRDGHSGGCTFFDTHYGSLTKSWVSVLPVRLPPSEQPGAITVLEGLIIWSYSRRWKRPPSCNK